MKYACTTAVLVLLSLTQGAAAQAVPAPAAPNAVLGVPARKTPVIAPTIQEQLALPEAAMPASEVRGVRIIGAQSVPATQIAAAFMALKGKPATAAALQQALGTVEADYAAAGFALGRAYIPAQQMRDGILTVRVLEGYIGAVVIKTDTPRIKDTAARYAQKLLALRPLRSRDMERYLRLIAEIPGVTASAKLTDMNLESGAAALELTIEYHPFTASLAVDTRSNIRGLPLQPYLTLKANNLIGEADQFSLTGLISPNPRDAYFLQAAASAAIGSEGWRLNTATSVALARVDVAPVNADLSSTQLRSEIGASYPLVKTTDEQMGLSMGSYFSQLRYELRRVNIARDRAAAGYVEFSDALQISPSWSGSVVARATAGFALPYDPAQPGSRANATRDFARLSVGGALDYAPDPNWSVLMRADGQAATGSLMAAEEVSYGADRFGRGYDSGVVSGDRGLGVSLQPQYRFTPMPDWDMSVHLFGDYAKVFNTRGDFQPDAALASAGAGLGVSHDGYGVTLDVAQPLRQIPGYNMRLAPRVFGTLSVKL